MTSERVRLSARDVDLLLDALAYRRREELIVPGGIGRLDGKIPERREHGSADRDALTYRLELLRDLYEERAEVERRKAEIDAGFDRMRDDVLAAFREGGGSE